MFRGAAKVTLDDKGRMVLPTRYREHALERSQGKLVVTVDRDQCLLLYPLPDWEQIERKLMSLPSLHAQARRLRRRPIHTGVALLNNCMRLRGQLSDQ